jgi:hypothetical protein
MELLYLGAVGVIGVIIIVVNYFQNKSVKTYFDNQWLTVGAEIETIKNHLILDTIPDLEKISSQLAGDAKTFIENIISKIKSKV